MLRTKKHHILSILCVFLLVALLTVSVAACRKDDTSKEYYLSLQSENWQTYDSKEKIPQRLHFQSAGNDIYMLTVTLAQGEQFFLRNVGDDGKIGFDSMFSAENHLVQGDEGSVKVAHGGTYVFSYDQAENTLEYAFTTQRLSLEITTKVSTLYVGDKYAYKAAVTYSDGTSAEETPVWASSNSAVLTVNAQGEVQAIAVGNATLTATIGELSDSLDITVEQSSVEVNGVQLSQKELSLELGDERQLTATVLPLEANSRLVTWSVDDDSVVTVDQQGVVTAVGYGKATITVSTAQGGYTDQCVVTVVRHVESISFSEDSITVVAEAAARQVSLVFSPADATNTAYTLSVTSGSELVSVQDDGAGVVSVKGKATGTATIKATSAEDPSLVATCTVKVLAKGTVLADMQSSAQVYIGTSTDLKVSLVNAELSRVVWSVSNSDVATVSGNGDTATITGVNFGSTTVTATVYDSNSHSYTARCSVLVTDEYFFIYGYGLGNSDWDWSFTTDREGAAQAEVLMQEEQKGVYSLTRYLTPDNGFQIIFPQVANFTQHDESKNEDVWNKNIPSQWVSSDYYYNAARSDDSYISNAVDHLCVNAPGVYKITLDLTGSKAQVYINLVSLGVQSVEISLSQGDYVLRSGGSSTFGFVVTPANVKLAESDISIEVHSDFVDCERFVSCKLNFAQRQFVVQVSGTITQQFTVEVKIAILGVESSVELYVLSSGSSEVPVRSIRFEQNSYQVNVNNGVGDWTTTVKATVNSDATNQQVRYYDVTDYSALLSHPSSTRAIVDSVTGQITARSLGTIKIKAVSLADSSVSAVVDVLFYSDQFYVIGESYGGWTALGQDVTTTQGSSRQQYTFTQISPTKYTLQFVPPVSGDSGKFKIVFLGMDPDTWTGEINTVNLVEELSDINYGGWTSDYDVTSGDQNNIVIITRAEYLLTIDLSMHRPVLLIDRLDKDVADDYVLSFNGDTNLHRGEKATARLFTVPFKNIRENEVYVSYQGNEDGYITYSYDATSNTLTFTVAKQEHSEDKTVTVTIKVGDTVNELTFTVVAEHHLELTRDNDYHWYRCTDDGCSYIEDSNGVAGKKTPHDQQDSLSANAEGHYYACSGCGAEFGMQPHVYQLNDGVFDFSEGMEQCSVCGFHIFEIQGNTLKSYYGYAETVNVPDNVTVIGDHAFDGHSELITLTFSRQVSEFGNYAFAGCTNLTSVQMTNYLTKIGEHAFDGTAAKLNWGRALSLKAFGGFSFYGYLGTSIEIPSTIETLGISCFANSRLEHLVIPNTVQSYGIDMCKDCTSLISVELGEGVKILGGGNFARCTSLETVIIRGTKFYEFAGGVFDGDLALKAVYIERPLDQILTCAWLFMRGEDVLLKGKVFVYSANDTGNNPCGNSYSDYFGYFRDWIAGCWRWDDSGEHELDNIVIWHNGNSTASANILASLPVILNDRKELYV